MNELAIVGRFGKAYELGNHFESAAKELEIPHTCFDASEAFPRSLWLRRISRRLFDDLSLESFSFNQRLQDYLKTRRPKWLLSTGVVPIFARTLQIARQMGVKTLHFSSDNPLIPEVTTRWYLKALHHYDIHATPRRATVKALESMYGSKTMYLPFAYSPECHFLDAETEEDPTSGDVLFVGYGDADRYAFFEHLTNNGIRPVLYGGGWNKHPKLKQFWKGFANLETQRTLYKKLPISICLVRHLNKDGHVMRTFEAPAMGACLVMERTDEQQDIFGEEDSTVRYFQDPTELLTVCKELLKDQSARSRLRQEAHRCITENSHSYKHRLQQLLDTAL